MLRLPVKTASLPKFSNSRSLKKQLTLAFILFVQILFFMHMAFKDLLKDVYIYHFEASLVIVANYSISFND